MNIGVLQPDIMDDRFLFEQEPICYPHLGIAGIEKGIMGLPLNIKSLQIYMVKEVDTDVCNFNFCFQLF